jgi:hypothetical protein
LGAGLVNSEIFERAMSLRNGLHNQPPNAHVRNSRILLLSNAMVAGAMKNIDTIMKPHYHVTSSYISHVIQSINFTTIQNFIKTDK